MKHLEFKKKLLKHGLHLPYNTPQNTPRTVRKSFKSILCDITYNPKLLPVHPRPTYKPITNTLSPFHSVTHYIPFYKEPVYFSTW
jgi:hypothetical protein